MKKSILLFLSFFISILVQSQNEIDSLLTLYKVSKADTQRVMLLNTISQFYIHTGAYDLSISKSEDCIKLCDIKINGKNLSKRELEIYNMSKADSYSAIGLSYSDRGNYEKAKEFLLKALKIHTDTKNKKGQSRTYNNLGLVEFDNGKYDESLKYHFASLEINEEIGNTKGMASSLNNMGNVYSVIGKFDKSRENYNAALLIYIKDGRKMGIANAYNNIGLVCDEQTKYDSAIYFLNKALVIRTEINDQKGIAACYTNVAGVYSKQQKLSKAITYFRQALKIKEEIGDVPGAASAQLNLATIYSKLKKHNEAITFAEKGFKIMQELNALDDLVSASESLSQIYSNAGRYKEAYDFHVQFVERKDSLFNETKTKIMQEMQTKYETEKKEKENLLLNTQNQLSSETIKQQTTVSYFIIFCLLLALGLAFFIFKGLKTQRKATKIISLQKLEVESQKHIVEEHQKETLDSIHYAKRIQTALLANQEHIDSHLSQNFVLFKPKDIVSGDFYWATEHNNKFYLAVCDCTGHGVPGAFMSLLNIGFLSEAIKEKNITDPGEIFNYVRKRLIISISSDGQQDGMDGILIRIDKKTNEITYSAANNEPVLVSNNQILELPKDKMPVGKGEKIECFARVYFDSVCFK